MRRTFQAEVTGHANVLRTTEHFLLQAKRKQCGWEVVVSGSFIWDEAGEMVGIKSPRALKLMTRTWYFLWGTMHSH